MHTPIYQSLFSKQLFPKDQFSKQALGWTADSLSSERWQLSWEGPVQSWHTETSKQTQHCTGKGGSVAEYKRYDARCAMEQQTI